MHLRPWSNEKNQVWAYNIASDKFFQVNREKICRRRDYYCFENDVEIPYTIEEVFSEEIETPAVESLKKLIALDIQNFNKQDHDNLCFYFAFLVLRTTFAHQRMNKIAIKLQHESAMNILNDQKKFLEFEKEWKEDHPDKSFPKREELLESIQSDKIVWKIKGNDHNLSIMFKLAQPMKDSYKNQKWTLFIAPKEGEFICNDHPVVTTTWSSTFGTHTETIIPLSPKTCLFLEKGKKFDGTKTQYVHRNLVREVNKQLVAHTDIFFVSSNEKLLRRMIRVYKSSIGLIDEIKEITPGNFLKKAPFQPISKLLSSYE
jgi:hypothetical protein